MDAAGASFLLVDDNEVFLGLIEGMIQRAYPSAKISKATAGGQALSMLIENPVDVILLDYRLPDLDGVEVLAELRKNSVDSAVVIVTGEGDERLAAGDAGSGLGPAELAESARAAFEEVVRLDPGNGNARHNMGYCSRLAGRLDESVTILIV